MNKRYRIILIVFLIIILTFGIFPISEVKAANEPKMADLPYDIKFTEVDGRYALDADGNLWLWGATLSYGSFADGTTGGTSAPKQVKTPVKFKKITNDGYKTYIAIDVNGNLWSWGDNNELAMLGNGYVIDYSTTASNEVVNTPTQITTGTKFTKVSIGTKSVLALDENGNIWGWGANEFGELLNSGKGNQVYTDHYYYQNVPKQLTTGTKYIDIQCEGYNAGAIDENNNLYLWGSNSYGQLAATSETYSFDMGFGSTVYGSYNPILIKSGTKFIDFSIGESYVVAIDSSNNLWAWGRAKEGGLGIKVSSLSTDNGYVIQGYMQTIPLKVGSGYTDVYCASGVTYARKDDKNYVWGDNSSGGFGDGTTTSSETPHYVSYSLDIVGKRLGMDENGDLWAWGLNYIDAEGNTVQALEPIQITGAKSEYTVTFMNGTETVKTQTVTEGEPATAPTLTKVGYTLSWDTDFSNVTSDLTVKAIWTPNTNTAYKVEHYKQNASLNGYTLSETEDKTGTTGAVAVATAKTYTGFTENTSYSGRVATGNIAGDGSLVLKLYYDRNSYSVTLNTNGGAINSGNVTSYVYGIGATLPTDVTRVGYTFDGWYNNSEFTGSAVTNISTTDTESKTYYAKWTINTYTVTYQPNYSVPGGMAPPVVFNTLFNYGDSVKIESNKFTRTGYNFAGWNTKADGTGISYAVGDTYNTNNNLTLYAQWEIAEANYKVEHYVRNLDTEVEGYELIETEKLIGTIDTKVTAIAKTYEGFTENTSYSGRVASGNVAVDGSLVLKLYYNRNSYNITYELNGGTSTSYLSNTYTYGKELILSSRVSKTGYVFAGWYDNEDYIGETITSISETEIGDKVFYAKWVANSEHYITSEKHSINTEGKQITKVNSKTSVETFINNISTNGTIKVINLKGEEVTGDALVGTGYKVQVDYEGTKYEYEIAVRGDLDGNGKSTITDLSMINQALVKKIQLNDIKTKAADIDYTGKLTITDLSMMNQAIVGKIKL